MTQTSAHEWKYGTLALSGGGSIEDTQAIDAHFFSYIPNGARLLYIPAALEREREQYEACGTWFSSVILRHAREKNIEHTMLLDGDVIPEFTSYDAVYIGGGNTYKLLDYLYRNELQDTLKNFLHSGKVVYGGSAGAIIFGADIRTVENENNRDYFLHRGLNVLSGRSLICHYSEDMDERIRECARRLGCDILALTERSGVLMHMQGEHVFGDAHLFTQNGRKERYPS